MNTTDKLLCAILGAQFFFSYVLGRMLTLLIAIERNTRPPKPDTDIRSFIKKNTKGDQ